MTYESPTAFPWLLTVLLFLSISFSVVSAASIVTLGVVGIAKQTSDGQTISVYVSSSTPDLGDIVALYPLKGEPSLAAASTAVASLSPFKYYFPGGINASYMSQATVKFGIFLPNYRTDLLLVHIAGATINGTHGGFFSPQFVTTAVALRNANPNEPTQGHLSYVSVNKSSVVATVQWTTRDPLSPAVFWGLSPSSLSKGPVAGDTTTYTRADMCNAPANGTGWKDPGTLNFAFITVPRGRKVYYKFGSKKTGKYSPIYSFTTPASSYARFLWIADYGTASPDKGEQIGRRGPETLLFPKNANTPDFSLPPDAGGKPNILDYTRWTRKDVDVLLSAQYSQASSLVTLSALKKELAQAKRFGQPFHALFINGDISYANGYAAQWDLFWALNAQVTANVPTFVVMGNHERNAPNTGDRFNSIPLLDTDSGGECGVPTLKRFIMPPPFTKDVKTASHVNDTPWYSIDIGPVHFVQYSSEHEVLPPSPQYKWIQADLESVDRSKTPWVVVGGHRPMHVSALDDALLTSTLYTGELTLKAFEDLFMLHEVDLVLHGHHHSYQRTPPVYKRNVTVGAPVYVVAGTAGGQLSLTLQPKQPPYFKEIMVKHGYLRFSATKTQLKGEFVDPADGKLLDSFSLSKPVSYKPNPAARASFIASKANASDQANTLLLRGINIIQVLSFIRTYVSNGLNYTTGVTALAKLKATRGKDADRIIKTLVAADVNAPDTLESNLDVFDFLFNFAAPAALLGNAAAAADKLFQFYLTTAQELIAYLRTMK